MAHPPTRRTPAAYGPDHGGKASPADVRRYNRRAIFGLLFPRERLSRAELGRRTGLSRVAVSDVVSEMLRDGLLRESGLEEPHGKGKRGTLLEVDPDRLRVVSVDLSQSHLLQGAATDLLGRPIRHAERALAEGNHVEADDIAALVDELMGAEDGGRIVGIGVATPGIVSEDGVVRESTNLGWYGYDLRSALQERYDVPVSVDNDAQSAMLAERFFGQGGPNLMFIRVRRGIGAGLLIADRPLIGESHASGEIGHISIEPDGPLCPCGKHGCLERLISAPNLERELAEAPEDGRDEVLRRAGRVLGKALAPIIGMVDMTDVCVYGPPHIINDVMLDAAQEYLDRTASASYRTRTVVRRCMCGGDITIQGEAVSVVFDHIARR